MFGIDDFFKDINFVIENNLTPHELLRILKVYADNISIFEISDAINLFYKTTNHVQKSYIDALKDIYIKNFILRIGEVKQNTTVKTTTIDKNEFEVAIELLKNSVYQDRKLNDSKYGLIYSIISLYTTYILHEPIHPVGSEFPGHQYVKYNDGRFTCPIKKNHEDDPISVCKFCIAEAEN